MAVIGTILKEKREQLGYTIEEISDITTIQQRYIVALEQDDFDTIPGEYYIKSFLKQYATILKLDSNKLIKTYEKYKSDLEKEDLKGSVATPIDEQVTESKPTIDDTTQDSEIVDVTRLSKPMVSQTISIANNVDSTQSLTNDSKNEEKKSKQSGLLIWFIIALIIGFALFFIPNVVRFIMPSQSVTTTTTTTTTENTTTSQTTESSETTQESTETTQTTTQVTTSETTTTTTQLPQTTTQATTRAIQNAPTSNNVPSNTVQTEPLAAADVYVISSNASDTNYGLGSSFRGYTGEYNLGVTVSEPTWVRITIFGQVTYEGTLIPNSPYTFRALNNAQTIEIRLGVAHAAKLTLNGRSVKVPAGNRVQNIKFTLPQ